MNKTKKVSKPVIYSILAVLMSALLVLSGVGIYFNLKGKDKDKDPGVVDPVEWATDSWDGEASNSDGWINGDKFANRGDKSYTIDSADSFVYFIGLVNDPDIAKTYGYFKDYTVYLNTNIDIAGHTIDSIGVKTVDGGVEQSTFQGIFDGSYYTIHNANIYGDGLFGYVTDATIQNIGLYNATINAPAKVDAGSMTDSSASVAPTTSLDYTAGIVAEAYNTNLINTYVRGGSINSTKPTAGLVGKFHSTNGEHKIENSFADTTINAEETAGIAYEVNTLNSSEHKVTITYSYYTMQGMAVAVKDGEFVYIDNVVRATNKTDFSNWDYSTEYSLEHTWCNYSHAEGSTALSFNYPILTRFNKVFMTGSCYENTVKDTTTGEVINVETIADAFATADDETELEVNIIVEKVFMTDTAVIDGDATATLNAAVDTTIVRSDSTVTNMIVGAENSTLILGDPTADNTIDEGTGEMVRNDNCAELIIDGNKDEIIANGETTGAAVYAQGYDVELHANVTIKDNINNAEGYGGGVFINSLNSGNQSDATVAITGGATITNCEATYDGGGACVVWNADNTEIQFNINNCTSSGNGGGLAIVEGIEENLQAVNALTKKYGGNRYYSKPMERWSKTTATTTTVTGTYSDNHVGDSNARGNGGGIYFETKTGNATLTVNSNTIVYSNVAEGSGGGICAQDNDDFADGNVKVVIAGAYIGVKGYYYTDIEGYGNTADSTAWICWGGGVYCKGSIDMSSGYVKYNYSYSGGGGLCRTDSGTSCGVFGWTSCGTGTATHSGGIISDNLTHHISDGYISSDDYYIHRRNDNTDGFGTKVYVVKYLDSSYNVIVYHHYYNYLDYVNLDIDQYHEISGYIVSGWSIDPNSNTEDLYNLSDYYQNTTLISNGDFAERITYYTVYEKLLYITSQDTLMEGMTGYPNDSTYSYNDILTSKTATKSLTIDNRRFETLPEGYEFAGWTTTDNSISYTENGTTTYNGTEYKYYTSTDTWSVGTTTAPTIISTNGTIKSSEAILYIYAVYKKTISSSETITETYYFGCNVHYRNDERLKYYGSAIKDIALPAGSLAGYQFYGWSATEPTFTNNTTTAPSIDFSKGDTVTLSNANITMYAVYYRTWNFFVDESTTVSKKTYYYNVSANASYSTTYSNTPSLSTFYFYGWSTSQPNGTQTAPTTLTTFTSTSSVMNYYAIYYRNFTFEWDDGNGNSGSETVKVYYSKPSSGASTSTNYYIDKLSGWDSDGDGYEDSYGGTAYATTADSTHTAVFITYSAFLYNGMAYTSDGTGFYEGWLSQVAQLAYENGISLNYVSFLDFNPLYYTNNFGDLTGQGRSSDDYYAFDQNGYGYYDEQFERGWAFDYNNFVQGSSSVSDWDPLYGQVVTYYDIWGWSLTATDSTGQTPCWQEGLGESAAEIMLVFYQGEIYDEWGENFEYSGAFIFPQGAEYYKVKMQAPENSSNLFNYSYASDWEGNGYDPYLILDGLYTDYVTDMSYMFANFDHDGIDVSHFNTSKVTNMSNVFEYAYYLPDGISNWNTSSVTDMSQMFYSCNVMDPLDLSGWDTSNVTDMSDMFCDSDFDSLNLSGWTTTKVTDMSYMFNDCNNLESLDVTGWKCNRVTDMSYMFAYCSSLTTLDFSSKTTTNVTDMSHMFDNCTSLSSLDFSGNSKPKVTDMSYMFFNCQSLTDLGGTFNIGSTSSGPLTNMSHMFYNCYSLTEFNINSTANTSNVTNMSYMFYGCRSLTNSGISSLRFLDTNSVTNMSHMFDGCSSITSLSNYLSYNSTYYWDVSNVTDMSYMFANCTSLKNTASSLNAETFTPYSLTNVSHMFENCSSIETLTLENFCHNYDLDGTYIECLVTDMSYMFAGCTSLTTLTLSEYFYTYYVENMTRMFYNCSAITTLDLSSFNTQDVTSATDMLTGMTSLTTLYTPTTTGSVSIALPVVMTDANVAVAERVLLTAIPADMSESRTYVICNVITANAGSGTAAQDSESTWKLNGNTATRIVLAGETFLLPSATRSGYAFAGWSTDESNNLSYTANAEINIATASSTYYAVYSRSAYAIGTANTAYSGDTVTEYCAYNGEINTITVNVPSSVTLSGYNFSGWSTSNDTFSATTTIPDTVTTIDVTCTSATNTTTIYAVFSRAWNFIYTSEADGGLDGTSIVVYYPYNMTANAELSWSHVPTDMAGFIGWSTADDDTAEFTNETGTVTSTTANPVFYAVLLVREDKAFLLKTWKSNLGIAINTITSVTFTKTQPTSGTPISVGANDQAGSTAWSEKSPCYDISAYVSGTVVTIYSPVDIYAPTNSSYLFCGSSSDSSFKALTSLAFDNFKTTNVANMSYMFCYASALTSLDVTGFDTSAVTTMTCMFFGMTVLTELDVSTLNTGNVKSFQKMFQSTKAVTTLNTTNWDTSSATDMSYMFYGCTALKNLDVSNWDTSSVTNMTRMFSACNSLSTLDVSDWDTGSVTTMNYLFDYVPAATIDVSGWDTSKVTTMAYMFNGCSKLTTLNVSNWVTTNVTSMAYMFYNCQLLENINVSSWNTAKVTSMSNMFYYCAKMTAIDVSNWNTGLVTSMYRMFYYCIKLATIDVSGFNTVNVTTMGSMFLNGQMLTTLDVSNWNTAKVTDMSYMFQSCPKLTTLDLSNFDTSALTTSTNMLFNMVGLKTLHTPAKTGTISITLPKTMYDAGVAVTARTALSEIPANMTESRTYKTGYTATANAGSGTAAQDTAKTWTLNGSTATRIVLHDETATLPSATRTGYAFAGWSNTESTTKNYDANANITLTAAKSYYAIYSRSAYAIGKYASSTVNGASVSKLCTYNGTIDTITVNVPTSTPTLSGFTFYGWGNSGSFTATTTAPTKVTTINVTCTDSTNTISVFAIWTRTWQFNYESNEAGTTTATETQVVYYPYNMTANASLSWSYTPTRTGFVFHGWSTADDDTAEYIGSTATGTTNPSTFYAVWKDGKGYLIKTWRTKLGITAKNITSITFTKTQPTSGTPISVGATDQSGATAWTTSTKAYDVSGYVNGTEIVIYCPVDIYAPTNSSYLFSTGSSDSSFIALTTLTLDNFKTTGVTSMYGWFYHATALTTIDVSDWDTSSVTNMYQLFYACSSLTTLDVSNWDVSKVTTFYQMFQSSKALTGLNTTNWDTSSAINMGYMFYGCTALATLDVSGWDTSDVTSMVRMFSGCSGLTTIDVSNFDTAKVTSMAYMFSSCSKVTTLDLDEFDTTNVTSMSNMFAYCSKLATADVSNFNTGKVTNMEYMFRNCLVLSVIDVSGFNTANVQYMEHMFNQCYAATTIDVSSFDTGKVTNMASMFNTSSTGKLENIIGISNFNTAAVTDMSNMFNGCYWLTTLDLSKWNTAKVTTMYQMFNNCQKLTTLNVSGWNTSSATNMGYMFNNCSALTTLDVSTFTTSGVTNISAMFRNCNKLTTLDLSSFNISAATNVDNMLYGTTALKTLKTPKVTGTLTVAIGKTMYDAGVAVTARTAITSIPASLTASRTYKTGYTATANAGSGTAAQDTDSTWTLNNSAATRIVLHDETATLPSATRTGYKFYGWSTSSSFDPTNTAPTRSTANSEFTLTAAKTYYAIYSRSAYAIGKATSNTYNGYSETFYCSYNGNIYVIVVGVPKDTTPTNSGFTFVGWSTSDSFDAGTQTAPATVTTINVSCTDATSTAIVYAVWKKELTYNNTSSSAVTITHYYDFDTTGNQTLNKLNPSLAGYTFAGYTTSATFTNGTTESPVTYECGATTTPVLSANAKDTYYAVYKRVLDASYYNGSSTIVQYFMYNSNANGSATFTYSVGSITVSYAYDFAGWTTESTADPGRTTPNYSNVDGVSISGANITTANANTQVYAVYVNNLGTRSETETLTHNFYATGDTAYASPTTTKTTPYTGVTQYRDYTGNYKRRLNTGGTAGTPTYTTLTFNSNPANPENKTGFTFVGWTTTKAGTSTTWSTGTVTPTANTNYYAVWKKVWSFDDTTTTYAVNYAYNSAANQSYNKTNPTLNDMKFVGYSAANDYTADYTAGASTTTVSSTSATPKFYACYTNTVTFDANGGNVDPASMTKNYGLAYGTLATATRSGYSFAGWQTNLFHMDMDVYKANNYFNGATGDYAVLDEYSCYKASIVAGETYTITNSGSSTSPGYGIFSSDGTLLAYKNYNNTKVVTFTASENASYIIFSVVTKTSSGRYDKETFSLYGAVDAISINAIPANHTLVASWSAKNYTITLDQQNGTGGTASVSASFGSAMPAITLPTRTGYTFGGYYTESNGAGTQYYTATGTSARAWDQTIDTTLYAKWTANNYTVTFDANGGKVATTSKTVTFDSAYGELPTPTRDGYTFDGWYGKNLFNLSSETIVFPSSSHCSNFVIDDNGFTAGPGTNSNTSTPTSWKNGFVRLYLPANVGTFTLTAKYTIITQGEISDMNNLTGSIALYINSSFNKNISATINNGLLTSKYTLSGITSEDKVYLEYPLCGNVVRYYDIQVETGSTATAYVPYVNTTGEITESTTVATAHDHTLTAKWTENDYTVTFDANGGDVTPTSKTVTYNSAYGELPTPTRDGYTFAGWYGKNLFDISKAENGSLLAASGLNYDMTNRCRAGFTYLEAGNYTVSINNGIKTGGYIHKYTSADASTWLGSNPITVSTSGDTSISTFNLERDCYVRFVIMPASNSITNLTIEMLATCEVQLEKGSTATAYHPYAGVGEITADSIVVATADHALVAKWTANDYTVTFDANGGDVTPTSKTVTYDSAYGELPTPTRDGYTFAGWYGKNLIDNATLEKGSLYASNGTNYDLSTEAVRTQYIQVSLNNEYTISTYGTNYIRFFFYYTADKTMISYDTIDNNEYTFSTGDNIHYVRIVLRDSNFGSGSNISVTDIINPQMEIGSTATAYEPYVGHVTAETIVSTPSDHTLVAKWTAESDIQFKVEHYIQSLIYKNGAYSVSTDKYTGFELSKTETFYGTTDATVSGTSITIAGFTYSADITGATSTGTIAGDGSLVLKLYYTRNTYTITLNTTPSIATVTLDGVTVTPGSANTFYYQQPVELGATTAAGYDDTTIVWYDETNETELTTNIWTVPTYNNSFIASASASEYTVTFDPNGGEVTPDYKTVTFNSAYGTLPKPTRAGYTFAGWYGKNLFDKNNANIFDGTMIQGFYSAMENRKIVYIPCKPNTTYTITRLAGNSFSVCCSIEEPTDNVTYRNADGTSTFIDFTTSATTGTYTTTSNAKYLAMIVIGSSNQHTLQEMLDSIQIEENNTATVYEPYVGLVTADTIVSAPSDHTLTALWTANNYDVEFDSTNYISTPYTIMFNTSSGTITKSIINKEYVVDVNFSNISATINQGVYVYSNNNLTIGKEYIWSLTVKSTASHVISIGEDNNKISKTISTEWTTFTGSFVATKERHALVVYKNFIVGEILSLKNISIQAKTDISFDSALPRMNFEFDSSYSNLPIPTRTGYTFVGWYLDSSLTKLVTASSIVDTPSDHTLIAKWTANDYTVTFDANGGDVATASKEVTFGNAYGELPTPTRDGYTFAGWYGKNLININSMLTSDILVDNGDGTYTIGRTSNGRFAKNQTVNIPANTTFTISYEQLEYTGTHQYKFNLQITFADGSIDYATFTSSNYAITRTYDKVVTKIGIYHQSANAVGTYTTFKNFMIELGSTATAYVPYVNTTGEITASTTVATAYDHTLIAHWTANDYTVTFDANGGNVATASKTVTFGNAYGDLPTPARAGYTFAGWYGKNLFDITTYKNTQTTGTVVSKDGNSFTAKMSSSATNVTPGATNWSSGWISLSFSNLKPSTTYTLSYYVTYLELTDGYNLPVTHSVVSRNILKTISELNTEYFVKYTFTTDESTTSTNITLTLNSSTVKFSNVQFEEGSTATEYVPYVNTAGEITASTTVATAYDHTLIAKWLEIPTTIETSATTANVTYGYAAANVATITAAGGGDKWTYSLSDSTYFSLSNTSETNGNVSLIFKAGAPVGTYTVTVTATSAYNGTTATTATITVTVGAANISNSNIVLSETSYNYDGTAKTPTATLTITHANGTTETLVLNTDYTLAYTNNTNVGTATVTATGKGNYTGTISANFTIGTKKPTLTLGASSVTGLVYNETKTNTVKADVAGTVTITSGNTSFVTVSPASADLTANTNTTITLSGIAYTANDITITIKFTPDSANYSEVTTTFVVKGVARATISAVPSQSGTLTYTGASQSPTWTNTNNLTIGGTTSGINATTYNATFTPNANYAWSDGSTTAKTVSWTIGTKSLTLTWANTTFVYSGGFKTPTASVSTGVSGETISFTYTYTAKSGSLTSGNAVNVGTYTATAIGAVTGGQTNISNYTLNNTNVDFTITAYDLKNATITLDTTIYTYDGSAKTPSVTVKMGDTTLTSGTDYTVSYSNNTNAGTAKVTISAKSSNFTGSVDKTFTINKANGNVTLTPASSTVNYGTTSASFTATGTGTLSVTDDNSTATVAISNGTVTISNIATLASGTTVIVTVTAAESDNYNSANATYTLKITSAAITGSVSISGNVVYNETLTANATSNPNDATLSYQWYTNATKSTTGGTAIDGATAKTYTIAKGLVGKYIYVVVTMSKANYNENTISAVTASAVAKAELAIPTAQDKTYTYTGVSQSFGILGYTNNTMSIGGNTHIDAGTYTVTVSIKDTANYMWTDDTTDAKTYSFVIAKATLTITAGNKSMTYGDTAPTFSYTTAGFVNNETVSVLSGSIAYTITDGNTAITVGTTTNVGEYSIVPSGFSSNNYDIDYVAGKLTVSQATLSAPSSATWSTTNLGTATWSSVTAKGNASVTYTLVLYRDSSVVDTITGITTTSYNFASILRATAGSYTFSVQAISGNTTNCASSATKTSAALRSTTISVSKDTGISTATINGSTTYTMIAGETGIEIKATLTNGYKFANWTSGNSALTMTSSTALSTTVSLSSSVSTGAITLTANADTITYTISYTLDGGSVTGNPTSYTVETATFILKNPTKSGYEFIGWTGSNGNTASMSVTVAKGTTGNLSYTANWIDLVTITIQTAGTPGNANYGITVNGTNYTETVDVRSDAIVTAFGTTAENQLMLLYLGGTVSNGSISGGTLLITATHDISGEEAATTWFNEEDVTITFVFKDAYKLEIDVEGSTVTNAVTVTTDNDMTNKTTEGYISTDATVTLKVNESTLVGNDTNKAFIGFKYTIDGKEYTTLNSGDKVFVESQTESNVYTTTANATNITVYVKSVVTGLTVNPDAYTGEVTIQNEDGFVMTITDSMTSIFEGTWTVTSGTVNSPNSLFTANGGTVTYDANTKSFTFTAKA